MTLAVEGNNGSNQSTVSSGTVTITTSGADRIIVLMSHMEGNTRPTITAVSDVAGLTWHKRVAIQYDSSLSAPLCLQNLEVWWAYAHATLTADTVSVTFSTTVDDATLVVFGVSGVDSSRFSAPWDSNAAVPATASNPTATNTNAQTTYSTTSIASLGLAVWAEGVANNGNAATAPSGWTSLRTQINTGATYLSKQSSFFIVNAAAQTGVTVNMGSTHGWGIVVDAISGDVLPPAATTSLVLSGI